MKTAYPKPSAMGGTLIRQVLALFKAQKFVLPLTQPLCIAVSGGVDSMVLAHLIGRYGRKMISPDLITLLHFDHQWRPESATVEKKAVELLARKLNAGFRSIQLEVPKKNSSLNLEDHARQQRNQHYARLSNRVESDLWQLRTVEGLEQEIELKSIGCSISMQDIYLKTEGL